MSESSSNSRRAEGLAGPVLLLGIAAVLLVGLWVAEVAGDPTGGFVFFMLVFGAPLVVGIALVVAASRRRDVFGTRGLAGSIIVLVGAAVPAIVGFAAVAVGLLLMCVAVAKRERRTAAALVIVLVGVVGAGLRFESGDGIPIFLPVVVLGVAALVWAFRRLDGGRISAVPRPPP